MKKIIFTISLCFLILALVSCSVPYRFSQDVSDPQEVSIEIVELDYVGDEYSGYYEPYSEDKALVLMTVSDGEKADFLSDFKKVKSYEPFIGEKIFDISGIAIRITYSNGDVDLITDFGVGKLSDGEFQVSTTTFDDDQFNALIEKYLSKDGSLTLDGAQIRYQNSLLPLCATIEKLGFELMRDDDGNASFICNDTEYLISFENKTLTAKGSDENYLICPPGGTGFVCEELDGELMVDEDTLRALFNTFLNYPVLVYVFDDNVFVIKR